MVCIPPLAVEKRRNWGVLLKTIAQFINARSIHSGFFKWKTMDDDQKKFIPQLHWYRLCLESNIPGTVRWPFSPPVTVCISGSGSGSGIRCILYPWIRDPGWVENQDPDPGSVSGMNHPGHISESLETMFWVKILKFFDADPGSFIQDGKNGTLYLQYFFFYCQQTGQLYSEGNFVLVLRNQTLCSTIHLFYKL